MKKILIFILATSFLLTGCMKNESEQIVLFGKTKEMLDNSQITLKKGYFVRDYQIDYENMTVTFNLEKEDVE